MAARRGATFRRRELGKELRRLCEKNGLTILEAAEGLGFSDAKLSRVETGNNSLPGLPTLRRCWTATALRTSMTERPCWHFIASHARVTGGGRTAA
ncbi:helix-turn-helix domain-containing protein [Streptomyces indonesiensis]